MRHTWLKDFAAKAQREENRRTRTASKKKIQHVTVAATYDLNGQPSALAQKAERDIHSLAIACRIRTLEEERDGSHGRTQPGAPPQHGRHILDALYPAAERSCGSTEIGGV